MRYIVLILTCLLLLCGCSEKQGESETKKSGIDSSDLVTEYSDEVTIILDAENAEASSDSVEISEGSVIITEEADYVISGQYNGTVTIDVPSDAKPHIILDSVDITAEGNAALYIKSADKVTVTLKGDNFLTSKGVFDTAIVGNIDGAVFSKDDLSFNGDGILSAVCEDGHGIVCKDDIVFAGGSYIIDSASHGIDVNNSISMASSTFDIKSGKDGFHCENTEDTQLGYISIDSGDFNITSDTDAISASYYISVADGSFIINAGGGAANASQDQNGGFFGQSSEDTTESAKGLKAEGAILIDKGSFTIDSADDALHSNTEITVKDGEFLIHSGDDGFHADDKLVISAGNVDIKESYEGLEAYEVTINGGDISIYASDDGINAAGGNDQSGYEGPRGGDMFGGPGGGMDNGGVITIEEGTLYINASGDGIDSNGELYINGGDITVSGPTVGDTATLDYATEGSITGGRFVGTGGSGMNMCFDSSSTQGVIMINAQGSADTAIILTDDEGDVIIEHSADQSFSCVILSCPELTVGQTYALTVGTQKYDITMGSTIYSQGGGMGGGMPGGGPGKGHGGGGMFRPGWN